MAAAFSAIGKDMAQPRPALECGFQDGRRAVAVLDVAGVNDDADQQAQRVDDDVPFAPLTFLPAAPRSLSDRCRMISDLDRVWPAAASCRGIQAFR